MNNIIENLENDLDLVRNLPQFEMNNSFDDDIINKLGNKSMRKAVKGSRFTFPVLATLVLLCILTFTSVIIFLGSDNNYENYRNYYLKTVATFYSLDGSNNYQIIN